MISYLFPQLKGPAVDVCRVIKSKFARCVVVPILVIVPILCGVIAHAGADEPAKPADKPAQDANGPRVVFVIGEEGYHTAETLPAFAKSELAPLGIQYTIVTAAADRPHHFPGLEAVKSADLVFLSVRRKALSSEQLQLIRAHLDAGKPLVAIRTSSHAFSLGNAKPPAGHEEWRDFDTEVLGCKYGGDFGDKGRTDVATVPRAEKDVVMTGVRQTSFQSTSSLYQSSPLGPKTTVLLRGFATSKGQPVNEPVAWRNTYKQARVFYTSLGNPEDFRLRPFRRMLVNAVYWGLNQAPPAALASDSPQAANMRDRNRLKENLAGNKQVAEIMKTFEGRGETGDDSEPTPATEAVKRFRLVDGFEMELVASEPTIQQPLYLNWDHRGRLWVVQYLQYPFPAGLKVIKYDQYLRAVFDKVPPPPPNHFRGADKITVLEDTNGDGIYDKAKDVITGLNIATAVTVGRGGIWVLNPPYLLFYPDADGDDVPDADPEVHLSGFGLEDTHSVANSLKWGPDGWLYGANGSTTTGTITSAATQNVHFKGQNIWRYHPDTKVFEIYAEGGGNTFSLEIDGKGRVFSGTNNGSTRGMHYAQGGYAKKNWGKHGSLTNPYAFGYYEHMRHEGFDERFSQTFAIYEGGAFAKRYTGMVLSANALHNRVWASQLLTDTSTFRTIDDPPLVMTADRWFRPVDLKVGPDGAVYMADWYDSRLTHVDPRDNWHKASGRIYRLKSKDARPIETFDLTKQSSTQLLEKLGHANKWFRQEAVRVLGERNDADLVEPLLKIAGSPTDPRALEALWVLNLTGQFTDELALELLDHPDRHVRRWVVRLVGDRRHASSAVATKFAAMAVDEPDVEVRSQLASTAKRLSAEAGLPIVRNLLARSDDLEDLHIPLLLWWAIESKTESDREAVLTFFAEQSLWTLPIVERFILERIMQRYAMAGGEANLKTCARLLELSPSAEASARLMVGLQEAFRGRPITNLPPVLTKALEEYQQGLGESDLALALRLGTADAVSRALKFIADEDADRSARLAYIEILGQINQPKAVPVLVRLLGASKSPAIKRVALQALMNYDDPSIGKLILGRYHSSLLDAYGVRSTAQRVLASRKEWALALLQQVDAWRINYRTIPLEVVQQMKLHDDPEVNRLIEKHWGKLRGATPAEKQQEIRRVAELIRSGGGELAAGQAVFKKNCGVCHTLFGEGGQTGPKLTGYERDNLDFILLAVIDPSAAIREEFTNFLIVTVDGRTLTGLIQDQNTRTVTLRGVDNQTTLINREDIEILKALSVSIMPDGVTSKLTDQEIKDLFAYLMSRTPRKQSEASAATPAP